MPILYKQQTGFTLIELILVIAISAIIISTSVFSYNNYQNKNDLIITRSIVAQSLRRAQILSQSVEGDSQWGFHITSGTIYVFKGDSFAGRNTAFDETYKISNNIKISGLQEVVFAKLSGQPQSTGNINISSQNENQAITINSKGIVSY